MRHKIGLLGATGFTGSLIGKLLLDQGISFLPGVRNRKFYRELYGEQAPEPLEVDVTDAENLRHFIRQVDFIVNCVGPFNLYASKVLDIVLEIGERFYMDITGEQQIILDSFTHRQQKAKQAGVTIVHSVAFESFLADALANILLDKTADYEYIKTFYYVESGVLSRGSRFTMRLRPFYSTFAIKNGRLIKAEPFSFTDDFHPENIPAELKAYFVPYPEVIFFGQEFSVKNVFTFYFFDDVEGLFFAKNQPNPSEFEKVIALESARKPKFIQERFREREKFYFFLRAKHNSGKEQSIYATGYDTYGKTAQMAVDFLRRMLNLKHLPSGVYTPAQLTGVF